MSPVYRKDIQGLRAIAISFVVLAHSKLALFEGGFIGVDIFFVISGFLITGILVNEYLQNDKIDFLRFYGKRAKRLLPSLLLMVTAVCFIAPLFISIYQYVSQTGSAIYALAWLSNMYFLLAKKDYFNDFETSDLFLHTWSLSVEEQYYLFWPALLSISLVLLTKKFSPEAVIHRLAGVFVVLAIGSFISAVYLSYSDQMWAFYSVITRVWQFALGGLAFLCIHSKIVDNYRYSSPLLLVSLGLLFLCLFFIDNHTLYPGFWALLPSLATAVILVFAKNSKSYIVQVILSNRIMQWLGERSYSWYLWHWPIFIIALSLGYLQKFEDVVVVVVLSLAIAHINYSLIEKPFWKGRFSHSTSGSTLIISLLMMALAIVVVYQFTASLEHTQLSKIQRLANKARVDLPPVYGKKCDSWYFSEQLTPCIIGNSKAPKTVVLIGDSVAAQWVSALEKIYAAPQWKIILLTKSSCPMIDEPYFYKRIGKIFTVCEQWREKTVAYIKKLQPEIVLLGSATTYPYSRDQWVNGSRRMLAFYQRAAKDIAIISAIARLPFDGPSCVIQSVEGRMKNKRYSCDVALEKTKISKINRYYQDSLRGITNGHFLDVSDLVCPGGICSAANDSYLVYRDTVHLTNTFVVSIVPAIKQKLLTLGLINKEMMTHE